MKIYYFSKDIERTENNGCWHTNLGNGLLEEYTSKEDLIREFQKGLDNNCVTPLTEEELASIICTDMPHYDYYTIQYWVDGFGNDTATATSFKTYEECTTWIADHSDVDEDFKIVGQFWGDDYQTYF